MQANRLEILLKAQVVCATLSGSGSSSLIDAMMMSVKNADSKKQGRICSDLADPGSLPLDFDAVVMDEAAQAVEPASLIPLRFNPR